ncbi:hypothetical protein [Brevundimonas sp.]|uniref:hypothetical protein n=1 Tax=Brevundimonas sp. TaxID=1871086 RepID=UPI003F7297FD
MNGMVIRESFKCEVLPEALKAIVVDRYDHLLGGTDPVEIVTVDVGQDHLLRTLVEVSGKLKPHHYYAHFVVEGILYVVFPNTIVPILGLDDAEGVRRCEAVAGIFSVPASQLEVQMMFRFEHSD